MQKKKLSSNDKEQDIKDFNALCDKKLNLSNEAYFLLENEIKRVNIMLKNAEYDYDKLITDSFSYKNYIMEKNQDYLKNFETFLNKKKGKKDRGFKSNNSGHNKFRIPNEEYTEDNKTENKNELNSEDWEDITYKELDNKIGIKEPLYCFCNYVSYGNMIKCDNPKCKRGWFHFHCVGLKHMPKGKWFCSNECYDNYKKLEI